MFYVYEWYNIDTNEIFYVGKGCNNRYKSVSKRNQLFLDYYETHECASRIIQYFEDENDAFEYEHKRILELKNQGMCHCNLDDGGIGGVNFVWTPEMRAYKSKYNPMKEESQRERMSLQNPMYSKEVREKVSKSKSKIVIYNGQETTTKQISLEKNIHIMTAQKWAARGYDTDGNPCYYKGETQPHTKKNTCSKEIYIDDIKFHSLREGADYLGVKDTSPLCRALKQGKKYKGHFCRYANQQPSDVKSDSSNVEGSTTNG